MEHDVMLEMENDGAGGRVVERAVGERNGGAAGRSAPVGVPDPELLDRPVRRRFSAEYKLGILREADRCSAPGEVGAILRREGLYSSLLSEWRKQRDAGSLRALSRPRGRKPPNPLEAENVRLQRRAERAEGELAKARKVIEVQGNVSTTKRLKRLDRLRSNTPPASRSPQQNDLPRHKARSGRARPSAPQRCSSAQSVQAPLDRPLLG